MQLAVVTATINRERARACIDSWFVHATTPRPALYLIDQDPTSPYRRNCRGWLKWWRGRDEDPRRVCLSTYIAEEILGVVPAFALGVQKALQDGADIIACLHDDLEIEQDGWDQDVVRLFQACPRAGLCGFGGARGLGESSLYVDSYNPMQLARQTFGSNMRHAEAHGTRWESAQPVACLDGFSQIGLRGFWQGLERDDEYAERRPMGRNLFTEMQHLGVTHHAYDAMLGCYAKRLGYQVWFLPIKVHHHGGLTAVADPRYHEWATQQLSPEDRPRYSTGDQKFWEDAHKICYKEFRDVLPLRT